VLKDRVEVHVEEIASDDLNIRRDLPREIGREVAVNLDGDDAGDVWRERACQSAATGADFEKGIAGRRLERGNQLVDPGWFEKVLAESLARPEA
jgi:hypothetical protein